MKILIDMNLSPLWVIFFNENNIISTYWSEIGHVGAPDKEIFDYAVQNDFIVFTNDLDFRTILANGHTKTPSVIQIRTQDLMPDSIRVMIIEALKHFENRLLEGALITLDKQKMRLRILPL